MDPRIIVVNFFLLLSFAAVDSNNDTYQLNDFVVKKKVHFANNPYVTGMQRSLTDEPGKSVMHKMAQKEKLAIFCKMEHEVMQASGFAVKFRLGDQVTVDQIEGK